MAKLYEFVPHPHLEAHKHTHPIKTHDQLPKANAVQRFNSALAMKVTNTVGTMWCAYAFALLAIISLPEAISSGIATSISWIAQTFLQLVLLSIIIVGQNIQSAASDKRAEATYDDACAILQTAVEIQKHLEVQDEAIQNILAELRSQPT